jgi:PAS domain S-box-containing protein
MRKYASFSRQQLLNENVDLKTKLAEAEETLTAIRNGEVDAIVVSGSGEEKIFTLTSAETPYRLLVEEMQEGAVTISAEGTILYCNQSFEEMVSIPMEQIVGSNFSVFIDDIHRQTFFELLGEIPDNKIKEEIIISSGSDRRYLHLSYCPMPEGVLGKICVIVSDITELKKYQEDLQHLVDERTFDLEQANTLLKESNAAKDKLFSIIAHDLKAPFTALLGFSELLVDNKYKYDIGHFELMINNIHSAAKSAYAMLENLLLWAMSQNKLLLFSPEHANIASVISDVSRNLKILAAMKSITIECNFPDKIAGYVDINMVKAILRNLISNAIKFSHRNGIIKINASSDEEHIVIVISDNGIGMTEETKSNIFDTGKAISMEGTSQEKGSGLGMIICSEFIEKHNGKLYIESQLGSGSTFTIELPQKINSKVEASYDPQIAR